MRDTAPRGYTGLQIALHWIVVVLVVFLLIIGEDMAGLFRALERGETPNETSQFWGNIHIWTGFAVLAAILIRLALRMIGGLPPEEEGSRLLALLAKATHAAFYLVLILMPVTGAMAYYLDMPAMGEIHEIGKPVLILLIALHVLGALWHQFVRKDGALMRMLVPR